MLTQKDMDAIEQKILKALRDKLGITAGVLPKAIRKAGRRLPRDARRAAGEIVAARGKVGHPKLAQTIDAGRVTAARDTVLRRLDQIDPKERRKDVILSMLGAQAFNLLGVGALVVGLMKWRGLL